MKLKSVKVHQLENILKKAEIPPSEIYSITAPYTLIPGTEKSYLRIAQLNANNK